MTASLIAGIKPASAIAALDPKSAASIATKARATAEDFESVFLNSMLQQMFSNVGKGPYSGGPGANIWRSFLTDEYSKSIVKSGGIGIADHVERSLLALQETS